MSAVAWDEAREWVSDSDGNRCSAAYFGDEQSAEKALRSLKNCKNCVNCSGCSDCSYCSDCSDCSDDPGRLAAPVTPTIRGIHAAVYAAASSDSALQMSNWHSCETTHCRAGWVVHLAGEAGYALESFFNTELAAMKIYRASGFEINPARFYDSDDDALADMKRLAEAEAAQ